VGWVQQLIPLIWAICSNTARLDYLVSANEILARAKIVPSCSREFTWHFYLPHETEI
jgi:hypothetical protein